MEKEGLGVLIGALICGLRTLQDLGLWLALRGGFESESGNFYNFIL
jgi:hypothetical protein